MKAEFSSLWTTSTTFRTNTPVGASNPNVLCCRNALLTALINSPNLTRYIDDWYIPHNREKCTVPHDSDILYHLHLIGQTSRRGDAAGLDDRIGQFWTTFCHPATRHRGNLAVPYFDTANLWRRFGSGHSEWQQQDPHEFLYWLLTNILVQIEDQYQFNRPDGGRIDPEERFQWMVSTRPVERIRCPDCSKYEQRIRAMAPSLTTELRLPERLPGVGWRRDLQLADLFTAELDSTIDFKCSRCNNQQANAEKLTEFQRMPAMLLLCLNRDSHANARVDARKNMTAVRIPKLFDVSQHLNARDFGAGSRVQYRSAAVVAHSGTQTRSGHYVSYICKGGEEDTWYKLNDEEAVRSSFTRVSDVDTTEMSEQQFNARFTPVIPVYDKILPETQLPGRLPMNVEDAAEAAPDGKEDGNVIQLKEDLSAGLKTFLAKSR